MQITLAILLYAYILLVAIFITFAVIHILHLVYLTATDRYGYLMTVFFLVGFIIIIGGTWLLLADINWSTPLTSALPSISGEQELFK
ncbi:MAG: hypothetical protein CMI52_01540 [Parcubacteria group bacterium]|nr:hypothetical protein [Parcubacteria group bacterium]